MDKIVFNDYDVTVEIYDSVIAKWMNTDYAETDSTSVTYLRNRDKIQPKLVEGLNIRINPETNEISAEFRLDQTAQLVSKDEDNELKLGKDGLLSVSFSGLLRNYGAVATREDLPDGAKDFDAYYITDESLYVFAHSDSALGLVWLPLSFYVDMKLYVSKEELKETLESYPTNDDLSNAIDEHNNSEESHPFLTSAIESIRKEMSDKEHFRGYYATNAEVLAIPKPERGDYAYSAESGTKWIYDTKWTDSEVIVPDQMVPPSDALPLMDGATPSAGVSNQYSRGDHVHPSDRTKLDKITSAADNVRVYAVDTDGKQVTRALSLGADANTVPVRDSVGSVAVSVPTSESGATPKSYVDDGLDKKVDRFEAADGKIVAYVANGKAQGVVEVSDSTAEAGTIACRTDSGALVVAEPENDNEAVPKSFLTKAIDTVQSNLDNAVAELEVVINANETDIENKVSALDTAYKAANELLRSDMATADEELNGKITALETAMNQADSALQNAIETVAGVRVLDASFATIESGLVEGVLAKAIGNSQMLIQFTPTVDITPAGSPVTVFSGLAESLLPSLGVRFGLVWDEAMVEQVGFCMINASGNITVNAVATLFKGTQYTLLL